MSAPFRATVKSPSHTFFLIAGYVCVAACAINVIAHFGLVRTGLPGLHGFSSLWKWALGAALCLIAAWYCGSRARRRPA